MSGKLFQPAACFPCVCSQQKHGQRSSSISVALPDHHESQASLQNSANVWVFKQMSTNLTYCSNQHMATIWIKCNTTDFMDGLSLPCGTTPSQPGTIHQQRRPSTTVTFGRERSGAKELAPIICHFGRACCCVETLQTLLCKFCFKIQTPTLMERRQNARLVAKTHHLLLPSRFSPVSSPTSSTGKLHGGKEPRAASWTLQLILSAGVACSNGDINRKANLPA